MKTYTVLLEDGTVGKVDREILHDGDKVTVELNDENGNTISKSGWVGVIIEGDSMVLFEEELGR